jgi:hypothetical protein
MANRLPWADLVTVISTFRPVERVKWSGDDEPSPWEDWIRVSSVSYLETGHMGPVPFREVEWVEIDPRLRNSNNRRVIADEEQWHNELRTALARADLVYSLIDEKLRFTPLPNESQN